MTSVPEQTKKPKRGMWLIFYGPSVILALCAIYLNIWRQENMVAIIIGLTATWLYVISWVVKKKARGESTEGGIMGGVLPKKKIDE